MTHPTLKPDSVEVKQVQPNDEGGEGVQEGPWPTLETGTLPYSWEGRKEPGFYSDPLPQTTLPVWPHFTFSATLRQSILISILQRSKQAGRGEVICPRGLASCHLLQAPSTPHALFHLVLTKNQGHECSLSILHKKETAAQRGEVTELVLSTVRCRPLVCPTLSLTPVKMREERFSS